MDILTVFYVYDIPDYDNFQEFVSQSVPKLKSGFDGVWWVGYQLPNCDLVYVCLIFFKGVFCGTEFVDYILFEEIRDNKFEGLLEYCKKERAEFAKYLKGGPLEKIPNSQ